MSGLVGGAGIPKSGVVNSFTYSKGISDATDASYEGFAFNIGKMRIMCGVTVTGAQSATGTTIAYAASVAITLSGFKAYENADPLDSASTSWGVSWSSGGGSHDTVTSGAHTMSETAITFTICNHDRSGRVGNQPIFYTIIGEAA